MDGMTTRYCMECGKVIVPKSDKPQHQANFCSTSCRKAFNNRRAMRGAQLYDLHMAMLYEREEARLARVNRAIDRLSSGWRNEDTVERNGRKSWGDWKEFLAQRLALTIHTARRKELDD